MNKMNIVIYYLKIKKNKTKQKNVKFSMANNMVSMLITNVHEYVKKKSMCRYVGIGKNSILTSDGMMNEKFE